MKTFTAFRGITPDTTRRRHIDNIFDYQRRRLFNDHTITGDYELSIPSANVTEYDEEERNGYLIELAAPGYERTNFNVNVQDDVLTISGKLNQQDKRDQESFQQREFNYADFSRSWTLPESADEENISAKYRNGILEVFVPTHQPAAITNEPRRIEIASS